MEEEAAVDTVPVGPFGGGFGPQLFPIPVSTARSYLCIRRFCSEPPDIDVF